jgi:3-hydroxy acid dehydrogenase/malonic semialdehyde reductase
VRFRGDVEKTKQVYAGQEPLSGEDIAEVIVFAASKRENLVIADVVLRWILLIVGIDISATSGRCN